MLNDDNVKVFTTKVRVTVRRLDLENALRHLKDRHIEGTTTQIEDGNGGIFLAVKTVSQSSGSGLVDNTQHFQASNGACVFSSLTLRVIEVSRHGNHGVLDGLAQVARGSVLELADHKGTNLRWRVALSTRLKPSITVRVSNNLEWHIVNVLLHLAVGELATDKTLGGEQSGLRVHDSLTLGGHTHQAFAVLRESNDRGSSTAAFRVLDDAGLLALHDRDTGVGRTQIDTDHRARDLARVEAHTAQRSSTKRLRKQAARRGRHAKSTSKSANHAVCSDPYKVTLWQRKIGLLFHLYLPGRTPPSEQSAFFRLRRPSDSTCCPRGKSRTFSDAARGLSFRRMG